MVYAPNSWLMSNSKWENERSLGEMFSMNNWTYSAVSWASIRRRLIHEYLNVFMSILTSSCLIKRLAIHLHGTSSEYFIKNILVLCYLFLFFSLPFVVRAVFCSYMLLLLVRLSLSDIHKYILHEIILNKCFKCVTIINYNDVLLSPADIVFAYVQYDIQRRLK